MPVNHRFYRHLSSFDFVIVELEGLVLLQIQFDFHHFIPVKYECPPSSPPRKNGLKMWDFMYQRYEFYLVFQC